MSGLFWMAIGVMATVAIGFVALPLLKSNRNGAVIITVGIVVLVASGLYFELGSPDVDSSSQTTTASRDSLNTTAPKSNSSQVGTVASMVDGLAARLRESPDDADSWLLLARSYKHLNRTDEAIDAYRAAAALGQYDEELAAMSAATAESTATGAQIFGNVRLSPNALEIVQATDSVFIFAKAANGPPAPLAVLQRQASELPLDFLLNDSQSMIAGMKLSDFEEVIVTARITRGGDATVALRGLEAKSEILIIAENRHLNLTIE